MDVSFDVIIIEYLLDTSLEILCSRILSDPLRGHFIRRIWYILFGNFPNMGGGVIPLEKLRRHSLYAIMMCLTGFPFMGR